MKFKLIEVKHKLWPINNKVIIINQNNNLTYRQWELYGIIYA